MILYSAGLGLATFFEKYHGTEAARAMFYYSPLFILLQFLMVVNFICVVSRYKLITRRKWGMSILHIAFIIILTGALVSHLFGEEGIMHIREGEANNQITVQTSKGTTLQTLPFQVELLKFTLTRYPGSSSPSSYESEVLVHVDGKTRHERIFMNNVIDVKGYRFFQASYDKDEKGTILSVNRDVAGRNVTYTGYFLLLIGFIGCFLSPGSRFRFLSRRLKEIRRSAPLITILLLTTSLTTHAQTKSPAWDAIQRYPIPTEHATLFGSLPMQSNNGRMLPVNTFSSEILRKLHKSTSIGKMNSDQFLISLLTMPDMWMHVPLIAVGNKELTERFGLSPDYCSYIEVFDRNGAYKLQDALADAYHKMPAARSSFDKELFKLDEKVNILHQLYNHQLINLFPKEDDPDHTWYAPGDDLSSFSGQDSLFVDRILDWYIEEVQAALGSGDWAKPDELVDMIATYQHAKNTTLDISPKRIEAEIRYNRLDPFRWTKIAYNVLGGLLLVLAFASLFNQQKGIRWSMNSLSLLVLLLFCFHTFGMGLRWYIAGRAPWSNSYETMVYVSWATVLVGLLFQRRSTITFALATLFGGIILFVSGLNWMDPQINPLVPVLKSPWLMFHVAVIVAAYGFFGVSALIGITNMVLMTIRSPRHHPLIRSRMQEMTIVNEMSLLAGLALMSIGTFLGAIWANVSWGRYWGWDPKETWALITMIVYAITLHLRLIPKCNSPWLFNLMSVISFASVLMTFFGVNYLLSGMHSYGQTDISGNLFTYLLLAVVVIALLAILSYRGYKRKQSEISTK